MAITSKQQQPIFSTLTDSLTSATSSLIESDTLAPLTDGISLLDTKNELLLTYLQNLVFLILLKLRNQTTPRNEDSTNDVSSDDLTAEVFKKLVELRIYIEKGVRPLESKLKYQIDKIFLAASEADAISAANGAPKPNSMVDSRTTAHLSDEEADPLPPTTILDLSYRPNPSAFTRPTVPSSSSTPLDPSAPYRPPRITPTSLPTTTSRQPPKPTKPRSSHTLDTFIREELDDAPFAEPSIGARNGLRGKEREREEERRGYEEQRLVRLPGEKRKKGKRDVRRGEDLSGGLGGLGEVDFGDLKGRRKRAREGDGGGGGEGERIGERWEKRVKRGVGKKRR